MTASTCRLLIMLSMWAAILGLMAHEVAPVIARVQAHQQQVDDYYQRQLAQLDATVGAGGGATP